MVELFLLLGFFSVSLSGILAFGIWGLTSLFKKYRMSRVDIEERRKKLSIRLHSTGPNGETVITETYVDYGDYFNFSKKDFSGAREYVKEAIKNGNLELFTTLEQSNELIQQERAKDD